jgi:deoxyribodipyrimidine photolyase-related protein
MPDYAAKNHFSADRQLPSFFWDGNTDMNCVKSAMQNVLKHGWTHHIERLMVLGNFAQLWGTNPYLFHEWHMAMYVDAIDWVSLPNTLGMSQYGDGGLLSTKPYCASGNYIHKMSNFCEGCRYDYRKRTGENACPFTTLYWHFLDRHADHLQNNSRMTFAMANLKRIRSDADELTAIHERAEVVFNKFQQRPTKDVADL